MIELLDPRKITTTHSDLWEHAGWSYCLDYSWIIAKAMSCRPGTILDVGCGVLPCSPLGVRLSLLLMSGCIGIDRNFGIDFLSYQPDSPVSLIVWASSLEHNHPVAMKALYHHSMELLAPGGLFLATITISDYSHWFEPSENQCLSPQAAAKMFDEPEVEGDLPDVWQAYRDHDFMMAKYLARYGHFNPTDPEFVIAGVEKVKP
jgi:hypothetical protein